MTQDKAFQTNTGASVAIPLPHLARIKLSGPDCFTFLQGQLTCDMRFEKDSCVYASHCTPSGRMISNFYIYTINQEYFIILDRSVRDKQVEALTKYSIFFKVKIETDNAPCFGLCNMELEKKCAPLSRYLDHPKLHLPPRGKIEQLQNITLINQGLNQPRYQVWAPTEKSESLYQAFRPDTNHEEQSTNFWKLMDMQERRPLIDREMSGQYTPHELDLPAMGGVSFDKGCYTGQEIVARMEYRGKLKSHMYKGYVDNSTIPLKMGAPLYQKAKKVGVIITALPHDNGLHFLALVKYSALDCVIYLDSEDKTPVTLNQSTT